MRLARTRRGKTPIDVGIVTQGDGPTRIRLTVGAGTPGTKNSDLDINEAEDLAVMLQYYVKVAKGEA